ncbi:MAG: glycosyltransferase [Myxococcales bacterium]|nr:MAG: glycosyltransferase [Myxococcales bacterium]
MPPERPLRLTLLTTWAEQCGIATYSEALAAALPEQGVTVSVVSPALRRSDTPRGEQPVRIWRRDRAGLLAAYQTFREIERQRADVVHIQHTMGIESPSLLLGVTQLCQRAGIPVVATLHEAGGGSALRRFRFARTLFGLRGAQLVIHEPDETVPGAVVIPHGIREEPHRSRADARAQLGLSPSDLVLAHFGFIHPDKGIEDVLQAAAELRATRFPDLKYRVCGGTFATGASRPHLAHLQSRVRELGLAEAVDLTGEFASEERVTLEMQAADLVVLNYHTGNRQGASGAANRALATGCALAVSRAPIFDSLRAATHTLDASLTADLERLLASPTARAHLTARAEAFSIERRWPKIALRHADLYRRLLAQRASRSA